MIAAMKAQLAPPMRGPGIHEVGDPFAVGNGHFEGRARSEHRPRPARHPDRAAGAASADRL